LPTSPSNVIILFMMKNIFLLPLISQASGSLNVLDLIGQAGWVVKGVMALLLVASIISWTIIFWKWWFLRNAAKANLRFAEKFWAAGSLEVATKSVKANQNAPLTRVFESGLQEFNQITALKLDKAHTFELLETNLSRTLEKASGVELSLLQQRLAFLASTASTSPFIGLFGTVWGIMTSFINIGATGASNLAVVAPGIAEALIATAMGLFAAIPAVLFYNYFLNHIRDVSTSMQHFASDFMNIAKRSI
jgi:biopolymer transport protein TolQ